MREILFRGKPTEKYKDFLLLRSEFCKNGFVYGNLVIYNGRYYICVSALCSSKSYINNGITTMCEVIPETVGQFTGLTDKKGKKIFEGDIIKYVVDDFEHTCKVVFDTLKSAFVGYSVVKSYLSYNVNCLSLQKLYELEVIGNKYDNPELLEVSE